MKTAIDKENGVLLKQFNTVENMHEMCLQEVINVPPFVDLFIMSEFTPAAWMAHYNGISSLVVDGINSILSEEMNENWESGITLATMFFLPDIFLDRNAAPGEYIGAGFHELTQAFRNRSVCCIPSP
jgi:hypothetical protein